MEVPVAIVLLLVVTTVTALPDFPERSINREEGKNLALIVAGSSGWGNYRHQADTCHAYQILHRNGIPDEHIVVMMYDDIANNQENPTPGIVINHLNGSDVYHGVPKDYNGKDVTSSNFLKILQGKKNAMVGIGSGKVIESGPNDNVFVYFTDHGAPGIVAFPEDELHAVDLIDALNSMYEAKKFAKLVFYLEACESGSMFRNLSKSINIYATSASNAKESSYACYYDDKRSTYLGDLYSVKWMEDSDSENLKKESLHKQFKIVKSETNLSHVQEFGDMSIGKDKVGSFQGSGDMGIPLAPLPQVPLDAVPSPDVPMAILLHKLRKATNQLEINMLKQQLKDLQESQEEIRLTIEKIVTLAAKDKAYAARILIAQDRQINDWDCYKQATIKFSRQCYTLGQHDFAMTQMYALVNLCEEPIPTELVLHAIDSVCAIKTDLME